MAHGRPADPTGEQDRGLTAMIRMTEASRMVVSLAFVTALFVLLPTVRSSSGKPAPRTGHAALAVLVHDSELLDQRPLLDASVAGPAGRGPCLPSPDRPGRRRGAP